MREELRIWYRMLRRVVGAYMLVTSVAMIGILPRLLQPDASSAHLIVLTGLTLVVSLCFLAPPLSPSWLSFPRTLRSGLLSGLVVTFGLIACMIMALELASVLPFGARAERLATLALALPGAALFLMMGAVLPVLAMLNVRASRSYFRARQAALALEPTPLTVPRSARAQNG